MESKLELKSFLRSRCKIVIKKKDIKTIHQENLCIMEFNISMNLSEFKLIYPVINLLLAFPNQI